MGVMIYTAIYEDPFDRDVTSEDGVSVSSTSVKLQINSNLPRTDEQLRQVLRRYLSERLLIADVKEEKIRIE